MKRSFYRKQRIRPLASFRWLILAVVGFVLMAWSPGCSCGTVADEPAAEQSTVHNDGGQKDHGNQHETLTDAGDTQDSSEEAIPEKGCPEGQHDDGQGNCTSDPCLPNPCTQGSKTTCVAQGQQPVCQCPAGTHESGDQCLKDEECRPDSCKGNGQCSVNSGKVACRCNKGYTGDFCDQCDKAQGFVPSPTQPGRCTQNPCDPNPCTQQGRQLCRLDKGKHTCECNAGTHDSKGKCVPDQTCQKNTCKGHGVCLQQGKTVRCRCNEGYVGDFCDQCDQSKGYHADGKGGCTDDPCVPNPCKTVHQTRCLAQNGATQCLCDAGYHMENGVCALDETCQPNSCNGHGTCKVAQGKVGCSCSTGYTGPTCDKCDQTKGYHPDGKGGCTNNPCIPNPCKATNRTRCRANGAKAECLCDVGTHDEKGVCVADKKCQTNTCNQRGKCSEQNGQVFCKCDTGYSGAFCNSCDKSKNYHSDGKGGCTNDPCTPNPCKAPNQSVCKASGLQYTCSCNTGYHLDSNGCIKDEVCQAATCSGKGACSVVKGKTSCKCNTGYIGKDCSQCDKANNYHPDGKGGCTNDPCLPNPCKTANKTVCKASGLQYACSCDAGYHADGKGGCTNDPCTPDPCLAQNKACRVTQGKAECYVPPCNDNNPCTEDKVVQGKCKYTNKTDGTSCTTSLCKTGQTCQQGVCQTGQARVCNDNNPCTRDSCDPTKGCQFTNDDTLVPNDNIACTRDACKQGIASHTPDDSVCNDNLYCTGVESCKPTSSQADSKGCIRSNVPQPPAAPGPCYSYGACSESTKDFPLVKKQAGASCNDGIACTKLDQCDNNGSCKGTPIANCGIALCQSPNTVQAHLNVASATVKGTFTLNGQAFPATANYYGDGTFYLRSRDTKSLHIVGTVKYSSSGGTYKLYGNTFDIRIVPGIYDLVYKTYTTSSNLYVSRINTRNTTVPAGFRVLQEGIVISQGQNLMDFNVDSATVKGEFTLNGQPFPATANYYGDGTFYLRSQDTKSLHIVGTVKYSSSGGTYKLYGNTFDIRIVPGMYDLVYKTYTTSSNLYTSRINTRNTTVPAGFRVLKTGIQINQGTNSINFNVDSATVAGKFTLNGQDFPATANYYGDGTFYLRSQDTKSLHIVGTVKYSSSGETYKLYGNTFDIRIVPGTYDLLYKTYTTSSNLYVSRINTRNTTIPAGFRVLKIGVQIRKGANSLNFDVESGTLAGKFTLNGQAFPTTANYYGDGTFYLRSLDTKSLHIIGTVKYSSSGGTYKLYGNTFDVRIVPGTYDLVYKTYTTSSNLYVSRINTRNTTVPAGYRLLKTGVVIKKGANTLDLNVDSATVSGQFTLNGQAFPATAKYYGDGTFYLRSLDTKSLHIVGTVKYSSSGGTYKLYGNTFDIRIVPGTYDLLYKTYTTSSNLYVSRINTRNTTIPAGFRVLKTGVQIQQGANSLNFNVDSTVVQGSFTLNSLAFPATAKYYGDGTFYLRSQSTKSLHIVGTVKYSSSGGTYKLYGNTYDIRLVPGTYDLVYKTYTTSSNLYTSRINTRNTTIPAGFRVLQYCIIAK